MAITRIVPSGSTNGKWVKITGAVSGAAVTLHTTAASGTDKIKLYATNNHSSAVVLSLYDGTEQQDITIAAGEKALVFDAIMDGEAVISAFADTVDVIMIDGYVVRVT